MLWTDHVNMRLRQRDIIRRMVTESVDSYRIVEYYPQSQVSRSLPSYLIYAGHNGKAIHILIAIDTEGDTVRVIPAYRPEPSEWEAGFLRRGKP